MKLTKEWTQNPPNSKYPDTSLAYFGYITLKCERIGGYLCRWTSSVSTTGECQENGFSMCSRTGPIRKSQGKARQDAQRLAIELLRDIRDGTKALMDYYSMGEDD